jgi:hypothetical protein
MYLMLKSDRNILIDIHRSTSLLHYTQIFAIDCAFCSKFFKRTLQCVIDDELDVNDLGGIGDAFDDCAKRTGLDEFIYTE